MDKIYSRKRFLIKPVLGANKPRKKINSKYIKIVIFILILIVTTQIIVTYIKPIFKAMCEEKVKSIATIITNQQSTLVMNKYQYEELYTIEKDENGNIVIIKSNVVQINNMISDLTERIQNEFDKIGNPKITISIGSITGIYLFTGFGPEIPVQIAVTGTVDTEVKSEFIAQGINQTLHRVYVEFVCNMKVVTPFENYEEQIINQVIVAEHVIVGNIPDAYYNLEGFKDEQETLNIIE